jgi:hypothetical protein
MQQNDENQTTTNQSTQQTIKKTSTKMPLAQRNPALAEKIEQLRLNIAPIVHVRTGIPPSAFPSSMLQLFLLTEPQLDAMAHYYSQASPTSIAEHQQQQQPPVACNPFSSSSPPSAPSSSDLKFAYPQTMDWTRPFLSTDPTLPENCKLTDVERLKVKMRMFARFIGMRGAETPRWEYERQVEILRNKIERSVRQEEDAVNRDKFCWGYNPRQS